MAQYTKEQITAAIQRAQADGNADAVDELTAVAADIDREAMVQSQQRRMDEMSTWDFVRETAKNATTQGLAFSSALGHQVIPESLGITPSGKGFFEVFEDNQATAQQFLQDMGIFEPNKYSSAELRRADPSGGFISSVIESTADPMGYLGTKLTKAAPLVAKTTENVISGLFSEFGSQVGEQIDPEYGGVVGGLAGGVVTPTITAPVRTVAAEKAGDLLSRFTAKGAKEFEEGIANKDAVNLLRNISSEIGENNIQGIIDNYNKVRPIIGDEGLPTFVALSQSENMAADFVRLVRSNPTARAKLEAETNRLLNKIEENADTLFGSRDISFTGQQVNPDVQKAVTAAERAEQAITQRLNTLGEGLPRVQGDELGLKVQGLITTKAEAVRAAMSKEYEALANEARKAGVYLPAQGTQALYDFVQQNNLRDIFGKTTQVDRDIMSILSPKVTKAEPSKIAIPPGARTAPTEAPKPTRAFSPMSFDKLDSLKRAINKQLRETKDPTAVAKLNQLKTVLNEQRKLLPDQWNQRLTDLDTQFYERVGVPFNNKAMQDIESREYAEKVAPILINNVTAAKTFIETIGEDSLPILKTTILSKLSDAAIKDGVINTNVLNNNIRRYQDVIALVPGLRNDLNDLSANNAEALRQFKAAQNQVARTNADMEAAKLLAADTDLGLTFSSLARGLDDPSKLKAWNDKISLLDTQSQALLTNRLRREVLAQATQAPSGTLAFIKDPNKSVAMSRLFGPDYVKQLEAVAQLNDMVVKMDPNKVRFNPDAEENNTLKKLTGVSDKQAFSVLRDRISGPLQKIAILFSKSNETRVQNARDRKMLELMLDPDVVGQMSRLVDDSGRLKFGAGETMARAFSIMGEHVVGLTVATGGRSAAREETKEQEAELRMQLGQ